MTWADITQQTWTYQVQQEVMRYSIGDLIAILYLVTFAGLTISLPIAVLIKLKAMTYEVGELREAVIQLCDAISGETSDDDPDGVPLKAVELSPPSSK